MLNWRVDLELSNISMDRYLNDKIISLGLVWALENVLHQEKTKKISRVSLVHHRSIFELRRRKRASNVTKADSRKVKF